MLNIKPATPDQFEEVWPIFKEVVSAGTTYPYAPDTTLEQGRAIWFAPNHKVYIAYLDDEPVATRYIRPNNPGLGDHIANTGMMIDKTHRGKGLGKQMMAFALEEISRLGYQAIQLNCVVTTNVASIKICQSVGFKIIGTIPKAFRHPKEGLVDVHILYKSLENEV